MPIDFPIPTFIGETFSAGGKTWMWNGYGWDAVTITAVGATGATGATGASANQLSINSISSNYVLALSDAFNLVLAISALSITIPLNSSVSFPVGTQILFLKSTTGVVSIAGAVGVTVNAPGNANQIASQYSMASIIKVGTDSWVLGGDII